MKIYTRTGDGGETGLFGGGRVPKSHPRVQAYGDVDELNSVLGAALVQVADSVVRARLSAIQHDLFALGANLATPEPAPPRKRPTVPDLPVGRIAEMERWMDAAEQTLDPLEHFILPGGSPGAAALHLARTVCRRAERNVQALRETEVVDADVVRYLNRLSDLLFTLARAENAAAGTPDVKWEKGAGEPP